MSYIPIMTEPYPDELLYSWIHRLSKINGLSISMFAKQYLNQRGIFSGELLYDIRHEFVYLIQNMFDVTDPTGLYLDHSSFRFDSLFRTQKTNCRIANNITLHPDSINPKLKRDIKIYACSECIKEDIRIYGEPYLHVRHHIGDASYCGKHKTLLMRYTGKRSHECEFIPETYKTIEPIKDKDTEYEYSCFVEDLYDLCAAGSVEDLKNAIVKRLNEYGYALHGEGYDRLEKDFNGSEYPRLLDKGLRYCIDNYLIKKKAYPCRDMMPLLMFLFESAKDLKEYMGDAEEMLMNAVCTRCKRKFLSIYDIRYSMGLCSDCYSGIPLADKFENAVRIANGSGYHVLSPFYSMNSRIEVLHSCGRVTSFVPRNLIYGESRCPCEKAYDDVWKEHFELLRDYKNIYGSNVPKRTVYKNFSLGEWCQKMRQDRAKSILSKDKEMALLSIGFDFEPNRSAWQKAFGIYKRYVKETGSGHVTRGVIYEGFRLGEWYGNLKKRYQKGTMTAEQILQVKILYLDFPKTLDKPDKEPKQTKPHVRFEDAVVLLEQYYEEYGTHDIAKSVEYKGYKLGRWANQMRAKRKQGILPKKQIDKLNEAGFDWEPLKTKWEKDFSRYRRYVKANEKTEVPKGAWFEHFAIGYWYSNLKISRKNGSLSEEQLKDILSINPGFV